MALGSDLDFYGTSYNTGTSGYLSGLLQPWQQSTGSYLGASSYIPSAGMLPATPGGFLESYIPELAGLSGLSQAISPEVKQMFSDWRFSADAYSAGSAQNFANTLLQREDVQGLLERARLQSQSAYVRDGGGQALSGLVSQQFGTEGSLLQRLYSTTGFGEEQVLTDIQRFIAGQESGLGNVSSDIMFGRRGQHTEGSRAALLAQLFGNDTGLIDVGGGRSFNPYSLDILADEYQFNPQQLSGHNVLTLGGGILSTQDAGITQQVAQALSQAEGAGFGGKRGYRLQSSLGRLTGLLGEGEVMQQLDPNMRAVIDQWYQGQAGSGWGRGMGDWFRQEARTQGLI